MRRSRLPPGGENVFQTVRAKRAEAVARGTKLLDLSIGEPEGPALPSARAAAAAAIRSDRESMHAYQYNESPGVPGFPERFVNAHVRWRHPPAGVDFLPIPGIKPMLGQLPLACGCAGADVTVATMTDPGYPIPADWCAYHPRVRHYALPLNPGNAFRFAAGDIAAGTDLVMMNYPHNPSGQVAAEDWLRRLCAHCGERDIRLFNDAAYSVLGYGEEGCTLSEVAADYPELSWAEAFTAAKLIGNGTGWHVGAMVGSPDFIADVKEVKGKTDAGHVAAMAAGAIAAVETDEAGIAARREVYRARVGRLIEILIGQGMRLAIEPAAGFYTLWLVPDRAFGEAVESAGQFNFTMIERTGVVGVHFPGYIRYAVCADVGAMAAEIAAGFEAARVSYT